MTDAAEAPSPDNAAVLAPPPPAVPARPQAPEPPALLDQRLKGIAFLLAGIAVFSLQDLIIKLVSGDYPIHQALTIRSMTALPILFAMVAFDGGLRQLRSRNLGALALRGGIMFTAYTAYYLGLPSLPIATAVGLYFTAPLFITLLSVLMLKETVGPHRWVAVAIGFGGVLLMVRPGSDVFDWASLLPVYAGLAYGLSQILARRIGQKERASVIGFYGNVAFLAGGLLMALPLAGGAYADESHASMAFLLRGWAWPTPLDLALMMACGVVAAIGLVLLTQAYRVAPASIVAPFEYSALLWGLIYGWVFWQELPRPLSWLGIAIVIAAGLYVLYRERATGSPTLWRRAGWSRLRRPRTSSGR